MIEARINIELLAKETRAKFIKISDFERACVDVDQSILSRMWKGKSTGMSAAVLYRICKAINRPMEDFMIDGAKAKKNDETPDAYRYA